MRLPVYMDHHATTPVDPCVLEAMWPYLNEKFGNAASRTHRFGWEAEEGVESARQQIAELIGAKPKEIVFTSGATESNNLALKGTVDAHRGDVPHIVTAATEHKAILDTCRRLEQRGVLVTYLGVDRHGRVRSDQVADAVTANTVLVTIMHANNEVGTIQPIAEIGAVCRDRGVLFHSDAAQSAGKIAVDVGAMNVDLLSLSGHKIYGPKGVGVLYVCGGPARTRLGAQIDGGGHERGLRSGTLNVPGIVGMGKACEICRQEMATEALRLAEMRHRLHQGLTRVLTHLHLLGHPTERLPGNLNVAFQYVEAESVIMAVRDVAVSTASACTSASTEPSHVLQAMGVEDELARASVRFGLGRLNTPQEVDFVVARFAKAVQHLRDLSPAWEHRDAESVPE